MKKKQNSRDFQCKFKKLMFLMNVFSKKNKKIENFCPELNIFLIFPSNCNNILSSRFFYINYFHSLKSFQ